MFVLMLQFCIYIINRKIAVQSDARAVRRRMNNLCLAERERVYIHTRENANVLLIYGGGSGRCAQNEHEKKKKEEQVLDISPALLHGLSASSFRIGTYVQSYVRSLRVI